MSIFPCKVKTENWYWNRQLQIELAKVNITWGMGLNTPIGWNSRRRKHLGICKGTNRYHLSWMTKDDFDSRSEHLPSYSAIELIEELKTYEK